MFFESACLFSENSPTSFRFIRTGVPIRNLKSMFDGMKSRNPMVAARCSLGLLHRMTTSMLLALLALHLTSCGTMKSRRATEQLLMSDAIDRTVSGINFDVLAGQDIYLDSTYIDTTKKGEVVDANYLVSALRQQLLACGCRLKNEVSEADYIVEARVGALATDGHNVTIGIPESSSLSTAASFVPNAPAVPAIPEMAFMKKESQLGAAKIAVFAYHRETGTSVWQSGIAQSKSRATDTWILGAGPFQRGSIYEETQLAGSNLGIKSTIGGPNGDNDYDVMAFESERRFSTPLDAKDPGPIAPVSYDAPIVQPEAAPDESAPDESAADEAPVDPEESTE